MKAFDLLATSQGFSNEQPNMMLAAEIIRTNNSAWVAELIGYLNHPDKNIQSDSIKVLYEIGEQGSPILISQYTAEFAKLLSSGNNRLVWGAMTALDTIAAINAKDVFNHLSVIIKAIDKGSVITIDHGVGILAKLSAIPAYAETTLPLLFEQLRACPAKQLPMYAEKTSAAINRSNAGGFLEIIRSRYPEMVRDTQRKRLDKVIKNAAK